MHYPSFAEYADALQLNLDVVLADPVLARGTLRRRGSGLPVAHGGTFALTFEIETDHRKYALRCFHKRLDALHERYDAITKHLAGVKGPYLVACQFQPQGITTESGTYPVVRMDWVEGQSLAAFVAEHLQDSDALQQLRFSLRRLARHLRENGIAHGDIQPSNIVVQRGANLRLIDYDGMFVPALGPFCSAELGQRNFQHPWPAPAAFQREPRRFFVLGDRPRARRAQQAAGPLAADRQRRRRLPAARSGFRRSRELGDLRPAESRAWASSGG